MIVKAIHTTEGNYFNVLITDFVCLVYWTSVHAGNSNLAFHAHVLRCNNNNNNNNNNQLYLTRVTRDSTSKE